MTLYPLLRFNLADIIKTCDGTGSTTGVQLSRIETSERLFGRDVHFGNRERTYMKADGWWLDGPEPESGSFIVRLLQKDGIWEDLPATYAGNEKFCRLE
jgi:hypothetical protein